MRAHADQPLGVPLLLVPRFPLHGTAARRAPLPTFTPPSLTLGCAHSRRHTQGSARLHTHTRTDVRPRWLVRGSAYAPVHWPHTRLVTHTYRCPSCARVCTRALTAALAPPITDVCTHHLVSHTWQDPLTRTVSCPCTFAHAFFQLHRHTRATVLPCRVTFAQGCTVTVARSFARPVLSAAGLHPCFALARSCPRAWPQLPVCAFHSHNHLLLHTHLCMLSHASVSLPPLPPARPA